LLSHRKPVVARVPLLMSRILERTSQHTIAASAQRAASHHHCGLIGLPYRWNARTAGRDKTQARGGATARSDLSHSAPTRGDPRAISHCGNSCDKRRAAMAPEGEGRRGLLPVATPVYACVRMRACVRAWAAKASRSGPRRPRRRWLSHVDGLPAKHQSTCPFPRAAAELTESRSGQPDKRSPLHPEVPRRARGHVQVRP